MPPATRKRSRDDTAANETSAIESSMTIVGDSEQAQKAQVDPSSTLQAASSTMPPPPTPTQDGIPFTLVSDINVPARMGPPTTLSSTMAEPAAPSSTMGPPSTKPPRSGQMTVSQQESQAQPHKPAKVKKANQVDAESKAQQMPSAQALSRNQSSEHVAPEIAEESDSDASVSLGEPGDQMQSFDWADLQLRHNRKMNELDDHEREALTEFHELSQFFTVWASTSQSHEVGRSFKRMKTQFALVQHHEDELEQKRKHFVKAYTAFQSALALLSE